MIFFLQKLLSQNKHCLTFSVTEMKSKTESETETIKKRKVGRPLGKTIVPKPLPYYGKLLIGDPIKHRKRFSKPTLLLKNEEPSDDAELPEIKPEVIVKIEESANEVLESKSKPIEKRKNVPKVLQLKCDHCNKVFKTVKGLTTHVSKMHKKVTGHVCVKCNKIFSTKELLKQHMEEHWTEALQTFKKREKTRLKKQERVLELKRLNVKVETRVNKKQKS